MTEKRFEVVMNEFDEVEYIMDKVAMEDRDFAEFIDFVEDICNENEQLKSELNKQSEIAKNLGDFRGFITEEQVKLYNSLKEENERLKSELYFWKKQAKHCPMRSGNDD